MRLIDNREVDKALELVGGLPKDEAETWYLWGKVYARMGDMQASLSCFNRAVAIDPEHGEAAAMVEISTGIYSFKDPNLLNH